jgi:hypothetical protein
MLVLSHRFPCAWAVRSSLALDEDRKRYVMNSLMFYYVSIPFPTSTSTQYSTEGWCADKSMFSSSVSQRPIFQSSQHRGSKRPIRASTLAGPRSAYQKDIPLFPPPPPTPPPSPLRHSHPPPRSPPVPPTLLHPLSLRGGVYTQWSCQLGTIHSTKTQCGVRKYTC